jgi:hypothetical protein
VVFSRRRICADGLAVFVQTACIRLLSALSVLAIERPEPQPVIGNVVKFPIGRDNGDDPNPAA